MIQGQHVMGEMWGEWRRRGGGRGGTQWTVQTAEYQSKVSVECTLIAAQIRVQSAGHSWHLSACIINKSRRWLCINYARIKSAEQSSGQTLQVIILPFGTQSPLIPPQIPMLTLPIRLPARKSSSNWWLTAINLMPAVTSIEFIFIFICFWAHCTHSDKVEELEIL